MHLVIDIYSLVVIFLAKWPDSKRRETLHMAALVSGIFDFTCVLWKQDASKIYIYIQQMISRVAISCYAP